MARLTIEEVIGIADEVIPMWRSKSRDSVTCYAKYLVYLKCDAVREISFLALSKKLNVNHSTLLHYVRKYDPVFNTELAQLWNNAISKAETDDVEFECVEGSDAERIAISLMRELNAKECRIDYVNGKIRVRYVEKAED